ncbi:MAG: hypothetical protein DRJ06_06285 [Candidatus Aminicenantes bacterium]|nr:MAG: hypothetical protein DRJ06_06285 [Candidatus Aminicenantes bacterium]
MVPDKMPEGKMNIFVFCFSWLHLPMPMRKSLINHNYLFPSGEIGFILATGKDYWLTTIKISNKLSTK